MEEVSEEIAQEDNGGTDDYLNEEFEVHVHVLVYSSCNNGLLS